MYEGVDVVKNIFFVIFLFVCLFAGERYWTQHTFLFIALKYRILSKLCPDVLFNIHPEYAMFYKILFTKFTTRKIGKTLVK